MSLLADRIDLTDAILDEQRRTPTDGRPQTSVGPWVVAAALSAAAGAIHLAMVPSHANEWMAEGIAFAVVGWLQVVGAVGLLLRRQAWLAKAAIALSVVAIAAWAWTRVVSMPFGPEAGHKHPAYRVDITCVILEGALVLLLGALAMRKSPARHSLRTPQSSPAFAGIATMAVFGLATWALASPTAIDHAHGEGASADHVHTADETAGGTGASATTVHSHSDAGATAASGAAVAGAADESTPHTHDATASTVAGAGGAGSSTGASGTGGTAAAPHDHTAAADGHDHAAAQLAFLFPDGNDRGWSKIGNGDDHGLSHTADVPVTALDPFTRTALEHQLDLTVQAAHNYPTVADAMKAGYRHAGTYNPGLGVHFTGGMMDSDGVLSDEELLHPSSLIYAGTDPSSPIAGFMYLSAKSPEQMESAGFAGPNDHWHVHNGVCIKFAADGIDALGADGSITQADCKAAGGMYFDVKYSMVHVWSVPAYTDPLGLFGHNNPALTCSDGTYYMNAQGECLNGKGAAQATTATATP